MRRSTIYIASTLAVFLIGIGIDIACGPEPDPYDYYTSFFHANLPKTDQYWSFYYNGISFLNDDNEKVSEADVNAKEWAEYLKNGVKAKDVKHAMYELPYRTDSLLLARKLYAADKLPDSLKRNGFFKSLLSPQKKNALNYYRFSKSVQEFTAHNYDRYWDPKPKDSTLMKKRAQEAFTLAGAEKDAYLKLRYYYQAQRLFHYAGNIKEAMGIYDKYIIKTRSNSHVMGWAMSLKAGEEMRLGNNPQAAYLFSKVFAQYPERRISAYYSFNWTSATAEQVIRLTKTPAERGFVYGIAGFHDAHIGLDHLNNVYRADPQSNLISVLLLREINKIEEGYLTPKLIGSNDYGTMGYYHHGQRDSARRSFVNYIPKLKNFCEKLATENKYPEPALGQLASAYLSWIQQDTTAAFKALAAVEGKNLRPKLYDEKQMITLLLYAQTIKHIDTAAENKLLPTLTWLAKKVKQEKALKRDQRYWGDYALKYYSASSQDFYEKILAQAYLRQKDTARAALCILRSEKTVPVNYRYYGDSALPFDMPNFWKNELRSVHLNKIIGWKNATEKRPYMRLMMSDLNGKAMQSTYDLLGTVYLREHKYAGAVAIFKRIDAKTLNYVSVISDTKGVYPDVFTGHLHDFPRIYVNKKLPGYNRLQFAIKMAGLQKQLNHGTKNQQAMAHYQMANGMYNTSYYGNAWFYTAYNRASYDNERENGYYYDKDYLRERTAEAYYLMARKLSNDAEFKARCTFLAAKCRQKKELYPTAPDWTDDETQYKLNYKKYEAKVNAFDLRFTRSPYFADLQNNYSKTKFYQTAADECSYFCDFLSASAKPAKPKKK